MLKRDVEMTGAPLLTHENVVEFWRRRFRRQRHVNAGVRSLLRKYGTSSTSRAAAADFLLTLMGNVITADACFYRTSPDDRVLVATVAFGSTGLDGLPSIAADTMLAQTAREGGPPRLLNSLPRAATDDSALDPICDRFKLFAPLHFENRLQGIVLLGGKVSGAAYTDNDIELIEALCAVTAAVLRYMDSQPNAGSGGDHPATVLQRCQEVASGIAGHLERSVRSIEGLAAHGGDDDADRRLAEVARHAESIRYLLSSLRQMANDPSTLVGGGGADAYDPVESVQAAVMSFRAAADPIPALNFHHEVDGGHPVPAVDRSTTADAVRETLESAAASPSAALSLIDVHIDRGHGLPTGAGASKGATGNPRPMLRVRIEARTGDDGATASAEGMKMLADNLEAFQTVRDPRPGQAALVAAGGAIVARRDPGLTAFIIYLPLASV